MSMALLKDVDISTIKIPQPAYSFMTRVRGYFHQNIGYWYYRYCIYRGIKPFSIPSEPLIVNSILGFPFDAVWKVSHRVREEEFLALSLAYSLGLPVPRPLSYGQLSGGEGSIVMTRIEGTPLNEAWPNLSDQEKEVIVRELDDCLTRLHQIRNPYQPSICSITGSKILIHRAPYGIIPPAHNKEELLSYLLLLDHVSDTNPNRPQLVKIMEKMLLLPHLITFTHGDLQRHNILVKDGHISGIVDWECAGWLPEYWD